MLTRDIFGQGFVVPLENCCERRRLPEQVVNKMSTSQSAFLCEFQKVHHGVKDQISKVLVRHVEEVADSDFTQRKRRMNETRGVVNLC